VGGGLGAEALNFTEESIICSTPWVTEKREDLGGVTQALVTVESGDLRRVTIGALKPHLQARMMVSLSVKTGAQHCQSHGIGQECRTARAHWLRPGHSKLSSHDIARVTCLLEIASAKFVSVEKKIMCVTLRYSLVHTLYARATAGSHRAFRDTRIQKSDGCG
jgi:hypothetical protein